jgi:hypothetical protein
MRAIVFDDIFVLMRSLLSLLFGLDFVFVTLGVCAFGNILSMVTLFIGSDRLRSAGFITLGIGVVIISSLICGGLVASSKVTRRVSVGRVSSTDAVSGSGVGSCAGTLFRMTSNFANASI